MTPAAALLVATVLAAGADYKDPSWTGTHSGGYRGRGHDITGEKETTMVDIIN